MRTLFQIIKNRTLVSEWASYDAAAFEVSKLGRGYEIRVFRRFW